MSKRDGEVLSARTDELAREISFVAEKSGSAARAVSGFVRLVAHVVSLARGNSSSAAVLKTIAIRVVLLVVNFGTGVIVARSLGSTGRGELAAIALWPTFVAALATLGIPTALGYHTQREPDHNSRYYAASVLLMLLMGVLGGTVGVLLMPLSLHSYGQQVVRMAQAFMIFVPLELLGFIVAAHLQALGRFGQSILIQLYRNMVTLLALAALFYTGHMSPVNAALSYTVPSAIQVMYLAVRLWPRDKPNLGDFVRRSRPLLGYGLRSYGTDIVGALSSQLDLAIIVIFLSPGQLGLYTIALTLSRLLNIIQTSVVSVVFNRASGLGTDEGLALVARSARLSLAASTVLGALLLLAIPIALPRVYGSEFGAAIPLMPLLTAEAIIGGLGNVMKQSFLARGRPFVVTLIEIGSIMCAVGFLLILVPRMNVLGAATALFCTSVVRIGAILAAYHFVLSRPLPRLLIGTADLRFILTKLGRPLERRPSRS